MVMESKTDYRYNKAHRNLIIHPSIYCHGEHEAGEEEDSSLSPSSSFLRGSSLSTQRSLSPSSPSDEQDQYPPTLLQDYQWLRFVDEIMQWKDVEEHFDQNASLFSSPNCLSTPAIEASAFGLCIGMEHEPEFANELLAALRRRKNLSMDITKEELRNHWCRLIDPCYDSKLQVFFDMCDKDMDGRVTKADLKQMIELSASVNNLSTTKEEAEIYASLLMQELDTKREGYIENYQLKALFSLVSSTVGMVDCSSYSQRSVDLTSYYDDGVNQEPMSKPEIIARKQWRRAWVTAVWLTACTALFYWKFLQYSQRQAFQVLGYCVSTAKGAAETLKLNMALILLPVCRNTMTWVRRNRQINSIVPFNDNINFHKLIAGGIVVGVILHGGTHLACDFPRITQSDPTIFQMTIGSGFRGIQPSYLQVLLTTEVLSGIIMVILMAIAFSLATKIPRSQSASLPKSIQQVTGYNTFLYSHYLFIFVYILLIIHSMLLFLTSEEAEKTTWMYIAVPILLYLGERIHRSIRSQIYEVRILKAILFPGDVLSLKLSKPEGFTCQSGMYIYIKCPQISYLEWHPFSLTSGPDDNHLSVHIRSNGDWSCEIYRIFKEAEYSGTIYYPKVQIDGPYGASSQDHAKYDLVILIGLGIGVTPFISVLKDIASNLHYTTSNKIEDEESGGEVSEPMKAYFYWVTREQHSLGWFRDAMDELSNTALQNQNTIEISTYLTSVYKSGDARSVMLSAIQALHFIKNGTDIFSKNQVTTHFARPDWFRIFSSLASRHAGSTIGVFYCGCNSLAKELESLCTKISTKTTTRFIFHKENY